jgi:hypothetical protein
MLRADLAIVSVYSRKGYQSEAIRCCSCEASSGICLANGTHVWLNKLSESVVGWRKVLVWAVVVGWRMVMSWRTVLAGRIGTQT